MKKDIPHNTLKSKADFFRSLISTLTGKVTRVFKSQASAKFETCTCDIRHAGLVSVCRPLIHGHRYGGPESCDTGKTF
jgi:hypothetical protein